MVNKSVSVIIPTLDRGEVLLNTLRDLLKQKYPDFEIIAVDQTDQPMKEVLDFIKIHSSKIKYLHLDQKGLPHARNVGVDKATGEIVLFLDDDIEIKDNDFIEHHIKNYQNKNIGLVGGRVIDRLHKQLPTQEVGRLKYWGLKEITNFDADFKTEIDHAPGGNFSCYRDIYLSVGGFSELYIGNAYREETDFCLRVKKAGYKLIFEPKAMVKHLQYSGGGCRKKDIYEFRYWLVHNGTLFYLRNYPRVLFPIFYSKQVILAFLSSLKRWDFKMFKVRYKALRDGIKYYKESKCL